MVSCVDQIRERWRTHTNTQTLTHTRARTPTDRMALEKHDSTQIRTNRLTQHTRRQCERVLPTKRFVGNHFPSFPFRFVFHGQLCFQTAILLLLLFDTDEHAFPSRGIHSTQRHTCTNKRILIVENPNG